jgi:hypothetical protein
MGNLLGKEKPLKEVLRENKRMITRAIRELDREKMQLEKEEKRLTIEIKKAAKEQQMSSVKIMAKVRAILRGWIHVMVEERWKASHTQICFIRRPSLTGCFLFALILFCFSFEPLTPFQIPFIRMTLVGSGADTTIHYQIHRNEITSARMCSQVTNGQVSSCHGGSHEINSQGHAQNEQGGGCASNQQNDGRL